MATLDDLLGRRSGRIGPGQFFLTGVALFALKFALDRTVATIGFRRGWSVLNYLIPNETYALPALPPAERDFYLTMLAIAVPFVWIGLTVTVRRLRDAALPRWLVGLFFIPAVNLLFFAALSVLPSARAKSLTDDRGATPVEALPAQEGFAGPISYGTDAALPRSGFFDALMPRSDLGSAVVATFVPAMLAVGVTFLAANVMRDYGWGLFVGMPFFVGMTSAVLHGYRRPRTLGQCIRIALGSAVLGAALMLVVALEGLGCLIMLMPLALPIAAMGAVLGYTLQGRPDRGEDSMNTLWAATLTLPAMIVSEASLRRDPPELIAVTTVVEVAAPPERVWPNVIEFGEIAAPPDLVFRAGVAYPLRARIEGRGVGAVRYCEFSTGAFVEPIEVWDAPRLLKFSVTRNPPPMREWSPWRVRPPHLDNFLVSRGGQFKLTALPGGRTRLQGTTWYEHRMWPQAYWRWWSDFLIHRIHARVLEHVKELSE